MTRAGEPAISVRGLTKRFGRVAALRGVDLELMPGDHVALLGPNGSGKTTLLKALAGLVRPTRGNLQIAGMGYQQDGQSIRRRIGVVSHHTYLYEDLSGEENLLFYGRMYGVEELPRRVDQALRGVGMERRRRDKVRTLSRGMQQRLALARATLHDPELLLLDEPRHRAGPRSLRLHRPAPGARAGWASHGADGDPRPEAGQPPL